MHSLSLLHTCRHIYNPGGIGERELDVTPFLHGEIVADVRDLPGFVLGNTTYESHHFWVHFLRYRRDSASERYSSILIRVHHGAGWELYEGDYMIAEAVRRYGPDDIGLFLLCWFMIDARRNDRDAARVQTADEYKVAFVEGRLRKRKLPARGQTKVWIEPRAEGVPA